MIPHSNTSNDDYEESSNSNSKAHSSYYNSYSIPSLHSSPNSLGNSFGINSNLSNNLLSSISNANTSSSEPSSSKVKVSYFDRYPERKNQGPYVLDTKLTSAPSSSRRREREREKEKEKDKAKSRESDRDRESHKRSNQTPSASSSTTTSTSTSNAGSSSHGERREDRERKERERERAKDRSIGRKEAKEISPQSTSSLGHGLGISSVNLATFSNSPSSTSTDSCKSSSSNSKGEDRSRTYSIVKHREQANAAAFKSPSGYPSAPSSLTKRHSKRDLKSNGSPSSNSEGGNVSLGGFSSSSETPPTISEERFNSNDHKTPKSNLRLNGSSSTIVSPPPAQMAIDAKLYAALKKDLGISSNHEPTLRPVASSSSSRKLRSEASSSSTTSNHIFSSSHGNRRNQAESSNTSEEPKKLIKKSSSRGNGLSKSNSSTSTSNPNNDWGESELSTSGSNFLSSLSRSYSSSNSLNPIPDISPSLPFPRSPSGPSPESSPSKSRFYSTQTSSTPISNSKYKQREEPASPTKVRSGQKREMEKESCNLDLNSSRTTTTTMTRLEAPKTSSTSQSSSSPRSEDRRLSTYSGYSLSSTGTASSYGETLSPTPLLVQVDTSWWDGDENQDREMLGRKDSKGSYSNFQSNSNHHLSASNSKPTPATYAASSAAMGKSRSSHSSSASSKLKTEYVPSIEDILRSHSKLPSGKDQSQSQKAGSSGSRIGAISPNSFDLYSSSIKSIPSSPPSRESSIHEGFTGSSSSSSNGAAQSHRSNRMYQANGNGIKTASSNSASTSNPQGSWGSRSMKSRHGPIPEYSELKSQSQVTSTRDSDQDLEPSEDSDDESISSADSIEREIRQSLRNERRKNKNTLVGNRPPIGARSLSASVDTNPTSVSGDLDADRSRDSSSPVTSRNPSKALHHSTSFPNRKILSKNSKAPPSPLELGGISSFTTPQPASRSKLLGKGVASAGRASPSAPPIRRRAVSTASTSSSAAAAAAASPSSQAPMPSLEDGSTVAHYLRSAKLTRLLKLVRHPNEGLTVSVADVGAPNGHPVVIFLGLGAVRYLVALYEDMAAALDLRLICIDRWGLGRTTDVPPEKRGVLDWASVVDEVTSQLAIDRFSVLAHSAGAPYAMATVLLYPNKIAGPVHLLAPWVNSTHEGGYKWLKYVPDTVIRTAQAAEWKMQGWKLGKNPSLSYEAVGSDGIRSNEGLGTPNSDSFDNSSLEVENQNSLEVLSSPALTSCSSSGPSPTSASHIGSSTSSSHSSSFSPQASLVETPSANRSTKTLKGKPSFLGGIFNAKHSGHSHSNSNPSARLHMNHSSSQSSLASPLASQDSDPSNHWSKGPFVPSKDPAPVGLVGRAASTEIPRPSLAEDLNLTSALFRFTDLDHGRSSSSVDGHTISGSLSLSSGLDSSNRGIGSEPTSIRRSISTSATGLPRLPFESSSSINAMPVRSASTNTIENSSSISIDPSDSSLGSNVFITPQMKQGGWINSSSPQRTSPQGSSFGNHSSSSNKSVNGFPSTPSSVGTPVNKAANSSHQSSTSNTPTSINAPADLTTALLRASHAESLKGGTADLMTILGRGAKPWGFTFSDVQHPVKVWHGDRDERISLTGVMWMEREMENCEVKIVKGAGHGLMTNVGVFVEALESIVDTKRT